MNKQKLPRTRYTLSCLASCTAAAFFLTACSSSSPSATQSSGQLRQNSNSTSNTQSATQKTGTTTKTGTITQAGTKYFIQQPGQTPQEIASYSLDLTASVGKKVTVTGQYSGDTLYVAEIK